ncbi:MAG: fatty acid hydroxylase [Bacteroidetes bacterium MedPE-SWsnd-G2]|nr:MAG: fatty acid hydroxylase [Bacteroidetes bacterium MedPE-SWsnd-G2]
MEFLNWLLNIDPNLFIGGLLVLFFTLEQISKSPFSFKKRGKHLINNLLFQICLTLLNIFFVAVQIQCIEWLNSKEIGLLYLVELPFAAQLILSIIFYDITTYWIHRASHKFPVLWRLHRVHHSDTTMDSSTTFRFHPLDLILVYQTGNIITAAVFGTDLTSMALYYVILYVIFFFVHANLNYPQWLNNTLGLVFVMPDHHRVHHHQEQRYTDSNFADIFILWDRLFGTYQIIPTSEMVYGLKEFDTDERQGFKYLMKSPFITVNTPENTVTASNNNTG